MRSLKVVGIVIGLIVIAWYFVLINRGPEPWTLTVYNNPDLKGEPINRLSVRSIHLDWGPGYPEGITPTTNFSLTADSCLEVKKDIAITFLLYSDNGSRLYIDGKKIVERWKNVRHWSSDTKLALEKGIYPLKVEFRQLDGDAHLSLKIQEPDDTHPRPLRSSTVLRLQPQTSTGSCLNNSQTR